MADEWTNIRMRKELVQRINEYLKTPEGKRTGYTNPSQLIDHTVRELIKDLITKRFEHVNTYEDKVRILDNQIGKNGDIITIFFREKSGFCEHCQMVNCVHVKYAWEIPEIQKILRKHGLKPPG